MFGVSYICTSRNWLKSLAEWEQRNAKHIAKVWFTCKKSVASLISSNLICILARAMNSPNYWKSLKLIYIDIRVLLITKCQDRTRRISAWCLGNIIYGPSEVYKRPRAWYWHRAHGIEQSRASLPKKLEINCTTGSSLFLVVAPNLFLLKLTVNSY